MDKTKQPTDPENQSITPTMYWGTLILAVLGTAMTGYALTTLLPLPRTPIVYWAIGLHVLTMVSGILVVILTLRGRQAWGVQIAFYMVLLIFGASAITYVGRALTASFSLLFIESIVILQLLPKASRLRSFFISGAVFTLIWVLEWLNPAWRLQVEAGRVGPATAIIFGLILAFLVVRQAWDLINYSISNRLTALVMILTIPLLIGVTGYISNRAGNEIEMEVLHSLEDHNLSLATNISTWLEQHVRTVTELAQLPDITSMEAERQQPTLQVVARARPNLFLVHTLDLQGMNVARNDAAAPLNYSDRTWFLKAKEGAPVTFEVVISRTIGKPVLSIAVPIRNEDGQIIGVTSIISELAEISKELLDIETGRGITYIVDVNSRVVAHPDPAYTEGELRDLSAYPPVAALGVGKVGKISFTDEKGILWVAYLSRLENGWGVISQQPETELLAAVRQFQNVANLLIIIGSLVMFALVWFVIRRNLQPIGALTTTVSAIAAGDLSRVAEVKSQDEIGLLASTFNTMTMRLRESFSTLEERVADRTRNLELAAEVGRAVSEVRALDVMLRNAAEIIRSSFNLYYVQVYLVDPTGKNLVLQAGTGAVGSELIARGHSLPLDTGSLNGRAAVEKRSVVIADTAASATFRPNALLPETRSEMAIPLLLGEKVVGVLDLQSREADALNPERLTAFEALASQFAIAIQNASLLAEAEQARAEVETQARRLVRTGWSEYLDAIHQPEQTGFVFEQNQLLPLSPEAAAQAAPEGALVTPIAITGEAVGSLVVEFENLVADEQSAALVQLVARQAAQQIENLRLINSAERYQAEAEQAARRLTREGWESYLQTRADEKLGYLYDQNTVRPLTEAEVSETREAVSLPLKIREEVIGQLSVQDLEADDQETLELASAVAERLSVHIENLRFAEQTQERAQREHALGRITRAVRGSTDPATILRSAARELGTLLGRKTILRLKTTSDVQASQPEPSAELEEDAPVVTSENAELVSPVESPNADGDNE